MVWGPAWLSRALVVLPSSKLLRLLRLRLLSMEVMLEEEVVRERARRVIPTDATEMRTHTGIKRKHTHTHRDTFIFDSHNTATQCSVGRASLPLVWNHIPKRNKKRCLPCKRVKYWEEPNWNKVMFKIKLLHVCKKTTVNHLSPTRRGTKFMFTFLGGLV